MRFLTMMIACGALIASSWAQASRAAQERGIHPMQTLTDIRTVAPALEKYAQGPITELWKRPGLSLRDRSIVTLAALIARNQTVEMPILHEPGARQWRQATRNFGNHHASRVLLWLGQCDLSRSCCGGRFFTKKDRRRSTASRIARSSSAGQGRRSKTCSRSSSEFRQRRSRTRAVHDQCSVSRFVAACRPGTA
jgi:hypothetical protein